MTADLVEQVLRELEDLRDPEGDPELEAVKTAILVEDVFAITLSDDDIDPETLGTAAALRALVLRHRGLG